MSDARKEVADNLTQAEEQLEATLRMQGEAEKAAVNEAQQLLRERQQVLRALGQDEGAPRLDIGELKEMLDAFDATPEADSDD